MNHRFKLATRETGHFGKFTSDHPRVTVRLDEYPVKPTQPENDGYWKLFEGVIEAVGAAKSHAKLTHGIALCFEESGIQTADKAALSVAGDWTTDLAFIVAKAAIADPDCYWKELIPGPFVDKMPLFVRIAGEVSHMCVANSGAAKWGFMKSRAQEIAWKIANGQLEAPARIGVMLKELEDYEKLKEGPIETHSRWFTYRGIGAPPHPAWTAMHAAAMEAICYVLRVMVNCNEKRRDEIILGSINGGDFRENLGVHTREDNIAGRWLGQETAKRHLTKFFYQFDDLDSALLESAMIDAEVDWLKGY